MNSRDDAARPIRTLIVGCGYVGLEFAKLALAEGSRVAALTRTTSRFEQLRASGIEPIEGSWLRPESLSNLPPFDRILVAIPHRPEEEYGELTHATGLANLVEALPEGWQRLIYLSTTGVYGEYAPTSGERQVSELQVCEETPVSPTRIGPKIAVGAENWLQAHLPDSKLTVLRLAGIYGPSRIPLVAKLKAGEPLSVPRQGHLNLVHVSDIARLIQQIGLRVLPQSMYLFSDGQPVLRETFYRFLAEQCGIPAPKFVEPAEDDTRVRRATDKCIDPSRIVTTLDYKYAFPTFREGIRQALKLA
ncbi:NAD-dependent epimerase/dehydratase family protein [Aureliella helgolandensis]|uniref:NAD-dependent epimerase/dehydratase domain-containing protein n=1 Tax=Aureliella helgolandensis TaxID=2527968 RepID=A0A518G184_9BACT|nr:NAD-dependent epimerase/dehydratase family protein [Aureliella helgolandensis]QDV22294.1 hypothetical protein Q31a_05780 [Aureliella helgolandensis]